MLETIEWMRNPHLTPSGYKDSTVFVSAVTTIFQQVHEPNLNDEVLDLLTYLLLRRQPTTGDEIPYDHRIKDTTVVSEKIQILRSSVITNTDRYLHGQKGWPYPALQMILELGRTTSSRWSYGGELALLGLSSWLFTRTTNTDDIFTMRACLKLYSQHLSCKPGTFEGEFVNDTLHYAHWMINEINRLCSLNYTSDELQREASYLGIFSSIVRACRMVDSDNPLQGVLREEVSHLKSKRHEQEKVKCSQYLTLTRKLAKDSMVSKR